MGQSMDQSINPWLPYRILSLQPWGYLYVGVGPPSFAQASCRTCWMLMAGTLWTFPKEPSPRTSLNSYSASIWNQKLMSWSHLNSITPVSSKVISWIHQPIWWGIKSMNHKDVDAWWYFLDRNRSTQLICNSVKKSPAIACRTFFLTRSCFPSWAQSLDRIYIIYKPRFLQFDWGMVLISPISIYFWSNWECLRMVYGWFGIGAKHHGPVAQILPETDTLLGCKEMPRQNRHDATIGCPVPENTWNLEVDCQIHTQFSNKYLDGHIQSSKGPWKVTRYWRNVWSICSSGSNFHRPEIPTTQTLSPPKPK